MYILKNKHRIFSVFAILFLVILFTNSVYAENIFPVPKIGLDISQSETAEETVTSLKILFLLTIISLAPSILVMMTSFTRIVVVLHFIRAAMGTQQTPPNQVMIGLALFLTLFVMSPALTQINEEAIIPFSEGRIDQETAITKGMEPLRDFMFRQTRDKDLALFMEISDIDTVSDLEDIPSRVLIPSFIISELKTGFIMGFLIYIPFIVIDMVVASTLMAMGMMMLPPVMISMPFKILLFILVDGWNLLIGQLVQTFR